MAKQKSNVVVEDLVSAKRVTALVASSFPVWVTATPYIINDVILESGKLYRCTVAHTAGASFSANAANWGEVSAPTQTVQTLTDGASIAWDSSLGNYAKFTLNTVGATLQNISNPTDGQLYVLTIKNNSQRYLNLGSKYRFNNSTSAGIISVAVGSTTLLITYDALNDKFIIANSGALISAVSYSVSNGGTLNFEDGKTTNYFRTIGGTGVTSTTIGTPTTNFFSGLDGSTKTVYLTLEGSTVDTTYVFSSYWKTETGLSDFGSVIVPAGTLKTYIFWCYIAEAVNVNVAASNTGVNIGTWAASTAYTANQIVKSGNRYLKRTAAGTSGATFDNTEAALWTLVSSNVVTDWSATTYYYEGEQVRQGTRLLKSLSSHVSQATFSGVEFVFWDLIAQSGTSNWAASTAYYPKEITTNNGRIIQRIAGGTSSATFNNTEGANQTFISQSSVNAWAASTYYFAGERVTQGNRTIKRIASGVSEATFTNTEAPLWTLDSNDVIGSWTSATYYYAGETLTDGNVIFTRTNSGISGASLNAAEWFQYQYLSQKQIPNWSGSTAYPQGMKVYSPAPQQTLLVLTASSHTTAATFTVAESSNWTFVSPALYYVPIATALYRVGDFALNPTNQTILMRNTTDHTFSTWTAGEAANWILISQGMTSPWTASTIYLAGTKVSYKGGTLQRIATGTSGATFDNTEGAAWISLIAGFDTWTANTYYYADTIIGGTLSDRLIKRVSNGISAATFSLVEAGAYGLVKPVRRMPFVGATIYYGSEEMTDVVNGTITYQSIAPHLSNATLDAAELTGWTLIGGNPYTSIANGAYTVQETDDLIDLPVGAAFTITIPANRVNPIIKFSTASLSATPPTIQTSGGETIISPSTYAAVASFVMPGVAGSASTITFQKVGTNYRFIG